jgi:hypothetical protein
LTAGLDGSIDKITVSNRRTQMRKIIAGTVALLMAAACSNLSQYTTVSSSATPKEKMRACMISEANSKLQAGTLFNAGISATADELVNICIKKLALQAAGISEESQSTAESIITNLKNLNSALGSN